MSNSLRVSSTSRPSTVTQVDGGVQAQSMVLEPARRRRLPTSLRSRRRTAATCARPSQHGVDAGAQLARAERLRDVVVGAGFEPLQRVDLLAARAQHHDVGRADGRIRLAVSKPSMPGMLTSSVVTSGWCARTSSMPSWPFAAPCTSKPACGEHRRQQRPDVLFVLDDDGDARFFHRCTLRIRRVERRLLDVGHDIPEARSETGAIGALVTQRVRTRYGSRRPPSARLRDRPRGATGRA